MNFTRFLLIAASIISFSATPQAGQTSASVPEIVAGPTEATVGFSPLTGLPSGWYTSDVTIHILSPADVLANGKLLPDGQLTILEEGRHEIELQPANTGEDNRITQIVNIDKTAPQVSWITGPNTEASGYATLSAEILDATSGICSAETSWDNGRTWDAQFVLSPNSLVSQAAHETSWSLQKDFADFAQGPQVVLLRAWDCAGNVSPGEVLVVRVK